MARYYFHMIDGLFQPDSIGEEFETIEEAKNSAITRAASALRAKAKFFDGKSLNIIITDVSGKAIFELDMVGKTFN